MRIYGVGLSFKLQITLTTIKQKKMRCRTDRKSALGSTVWFCCFGVVVFLVFNSVCLLEVIILLYWSTLDKIYSHDIMLCENDQITAFSIRTLTRSRLRL